MRWLSQRLKNMWATRENCILRESLLINYIENIFFFVFSDIDTLKGDYQSNVILQEAEIQTLLDEYDNKEEDDSVENVSTLESQGKGYNFPITTQKANLIYLVAGERVKDEPMRIY